MESLYDQLAQRALDLLASHPEQRIMIGIAGVPGSGKSTTSRALLSIINERFAREARATRNMLNAYGVAALLPMDGFHYSKRELHAMPDPAAAFARRGAPWTFDAAKFVDCVQQVASSTTETVHVPSFDHAVGDPIQGDLAIAPHDRIVLVEGNYLLLSESPWNRLVDNGILTESWFISCDVKTAMERVKARQVAIGLSPEESEKRIAGNDEPNALMIEASKGRATLIVPSARFSWQHEGRLR